MGEPKKKPQDDGQKSPFGTSSAQDPKTDSRHQSLQDLLPTEELDRLSTLQILDLIASKLPQRHPILLDLVYLRERIEQMESMQDSARQALEKFDQIVDKLRSPAFRMGTFLAGVDRDKAHVCIGGTDYVCRIDPAIPQLSLELGQRVLCNEAFAIVRAFDYERNGPISRIDQVLPDGRLRVGSDLGSPSVLVQRSLMLAKEKLRPGLEIRLDPNQRVALEVLSEGKRVDRSIESVSELPWSAIGGQDDAVQSIRDAIEMPFLHKDLFKRFNHTVPKGFLLHGPPGCGKTLLGKATAYNLRQQIQRQTGEDRREFFLHIKGPEVLNMWVGESERQVRDLFGQCRERAHSGQLAFLFIDEAESILGTRRGGRTHSILSTVVPMFCTEMDGIEPLSNVVIILASNRPDLIDPAILRPGRIDRKIRVCRPDKVGAQRIYSIYLQDSLPLGEPKEELVKAVTEAHFARSPENEFLEITYRSGRREVLYRGDLASGAIIAAVVERAKGIAIKRAISQGSEGTLTREDLLTSLRLEHQENDLFPSSDLTEDWLKLTDFDPENVVRLGPIRPRKSEKVGVV